MGLILRPGASYGRPEDVSFGLANWRSRAPTPAADPASGDAPATAPSPVPPSARAYARSERTATAAAPLPHSRRREVLVAQAARVRHMMRQPTPNSAPSTDRRYRTPEAYAPRSSDAKRGFGGCHALKRTPPTQLARPVRRRHRHPECPLHASTYRWPAHPDTVACTRSTELSTIAHRGRPPPGSSPSVCQGSSACRNSSPNPAHASPRRYFGTGTPDAARTTRGSNRNLHVVPSSSSTSPKSCSTKCGNMKSSWIRVPQCTSRRSYRPLPERRHPPRASAEAAPPTSAHAAASPAPRTPPAPAAPGTRLRCIHFVDTELGPMGIPVMSARVLRNKPVHQPGSHRAPPRSGRMRSPAPPTKSCRASSIRGCWLEGPMNSPLKTSTKGFG